MSKPASKPPSGKPWLWVAVAVVVVAAVGVVVAIVLGNRTSSPVYDPEVTGAPRAAVAETVVDHGAVAFEQPVESVYEVTNVGDQPLVILGEPRVELVAGC
jgi:ABC-type phosphate transport system auxiliary subunit